MLINFFILEKIDSQIMKEKNGSILYWDKNQRK